MVALGAYIIRASGRPALCLLSGLLAHVVAFGAGINLVHRAKLPEAPVTIIFNLLAGLALPLAIASHVRHPVSGYKYEAF